ncbi:hypothetical protein [Streptomyces sp. NPDC015414]|uniref:hypothetical protein n=1 Tax=Streptomyces sp. NPDC015414 TaxID=3364957 RepID=UPI0036F529AC
MEVKTDFQTYQSFWEKFRARVADGNPPGVFQNAVTFLRKYDKRGILLAPQVPRAGPQAEPGSLPGERHEGRRGRRQAARNSRRLQRHGARHRREALPAGGCRTGAGLDLGQHFEA